MYTVFYLATQSIQHQSTLLPLLCLPKTINSHLTILILQLALPSHPQPKDIVYPILQGLFFWRYVCHTQLSPSIGSDDDNCLGQRISTSEPLQAAPWKQV